jgi:hypothetical protein
MVVDVYRRGDEFIVEVDVPGMDPETSTSRWKRNMLSITGERPSRHDDAEACCANGPTPASAASSTWARTSILTPSTPPTTTVC